jgi:hypothetical protein
MELISINGVEISFPKQGETIYVPIKPICEVLGIDAKSQRDGIQNHPILGSVGVQNPSTGSDGKTYDMYCLPLKYFLGWLFTIDPRKVKPESAEAVIQYQEKIHTVIYEKFYLEPVLQKSKLLQILEKENEILVLKSQRKDLNSEIKEHEKALELIKASDPTQTKLAF